MLMRKLKLGTMAGVFAVSSGIASTPMTIHVCPMGFRRGCRCCPARFRLSHGWRFQSGWPAGRCAARRASSDFHAPA